MFAILACVCFVLDKMTEQVAELGNRVISLDSAVFIRTDRGLLKLQKITWEEGPVWSYTWPGESAVGEFETQMDAVQAALLRRELQQIATG
jgi:hypothetical protein